MTLPSTQTNTEGNCFVQGVKRRRNVDACGPAPKCQTPGAASTTASASEAATKGRCSNRTAAASADNCCTIASCNHNRNVRYLVRDLGFHRLRDEDFTYDWCDDHTSLVVWCPQCEVPVIVRVPFQASATATGDQPAEHRPSGQ